MRTEYDGTVSPERTITVEYTYDARRRLIEEEAVMDGDPPETVYHYTYAYDPVGNRTSKYEEVTDRETWYAYDTDFIGGDPNDPNNWRSAFVPWVAEADFETRNNRLVEYRESSPAGERKVYYTYRDTGHVAHITVNDEPNTPGPRIVKDLYLAYGTDEKVGVVIAEEWQYDPNEPRIAQMNTDEEHMFLVSVATRDICGCGTLGGAAATYSNQAVAEEQTRFLAGLGIRARDGVGEGGLPARFFHGDLIGSTMMETGPTGEVESTGGWEDSLLWQYTAFGEPIWPQPVGGIERTVQAGRYKYAGAYGYEWAMLSVWGANEDLPAILLLHVGERWYEPGTGRFVQRDSAGIFESLNVYAYCDMDPVSLLDVAGCSAVAAALLPAGAAAAADGPLPIGDIVAAGILAGAVCVDIWAIWKEHTKDKSKSKKDKHKKGRRRVRQKDWDKKRQKPDWQDRGPKCFTSDTVVLTERGLVHIDEVCPGDLVFSLDVDEGAYSRAPVVTTFAGWTREIVKIGLEEGNITCTREHPFWLASRGWVVARDLSAGDRLRGVDGSDIAVLTVVIEDLESPVEVYNISVARDHTYFVGPQCVLVHNKILLW